MTAIDIASLRRHIGTKISDEDVATQAPLKALVASGVGLGAGTLAYGAAYERHDLRLVTLDLPVSGLPRGFDGLRVGLITDIHHSDTVSADDVARAVTRLHRERPDLVVLGGDYVSFGERRFIGPVAELMARQDSAVRSAAVHDFEPS